MHPYFNRRTKIYLLILVVMFGLSSFLAACSNGEINGTVSTTPSDTETQTETKVPDERTEQDPVPDPVIVFNHFTQAWTDGAYDEMYSHLTSAARRRIDKDTFVSRYSNIFSGIRAENLDIILAEDQEQTNADEDERYLRFRLNMDSLAGYLELDGYEMKLILDHSDENPKWKIDWTEALIFPDMRAGDKVQARILHPKRGEIYDRNNQGLAVNDELITIGLVPQDFMEDRGESIPKMAEWLGLSEDKINQIADQATVPDWFYPVVTLAAAQSDLSARLTALPGVQFQRTEGRVYPGGEATGLLAGYMGPITAEELERYPDQGYTAHDQIGKMGLELAFESRLRGERGGEIVLVDDDTGRVIHEVVRKDPVHGERIQLAIDLDVQQKIYHEMRDEPGSAAAIDPRTGEILALVSTPSFDSNVFQTYIPDDVRNQWNDSEHSYFLNRFNSGYAPGSVFKLVTAAIGLNNQTLDADEVIPISGLHWRPSDSWGSYRVTRVRDSGAVDFRDAMVYSDNIYFAMQALRLGRQAFETGADAFGLNEAMPMTYPFYRSQLSNDGLSRETLIADTGYGQGEILTSSLHMALIYGTLASDGNMMKPVLERTDSFSPEIWKAGAVEQQYIPLLRDVLRQVVEDPSGSGFTQTEMKRQILGKTGTAELKTSLDDEDALENGWFIAMDMEQDSLVLAMMIERVDDRGGSRYVVPFVKKAMNEIFSQ